MDLTLTTLDALLVLFLAFALGLLVAAIRTHWRQRHLYKPRMCKPDAHEWRTIVAPYASQCLHCRTIRYAIDAKGNFPDGLREYLENPRGSGEVSTPRPPWICADCFDAMVVEAICDTCGLGMTLGDDPKTGQEIWFCRKCGNRDPANKGLGPIYRCLKCHSWRKL